MKNKVTKFTIFAILIILLVPINYFLFNNAPSEDVQDVQEEVINAITGIDVDLNRNGK